MEIDPETAETLRRESNASRLRSSSVGAAPRPKRLFTTRAQSAAEAALDVRCACQFFQTTALLPERVNPVGSRPSSSVGFFSHDQEQLHHHHLRLQQEDAAVDAELEAVLGRGEDPLGGSDFSFGPVHGDMDYYAESVSSRPNSPMHRPLEERPLLLNLQPTGVGSTMELDPCLQPRPLQQKDPCTSVLLQRRNSQTQIDLQNSLSPFAVPLKRNASQRSFEIVVAPICQRDPSTSSLVRKKMGQSQLQSRAGSQFGLENSFIPIQAPAPLSLSVSPDSRRPRGPYPGEAYPPDYEHMGESVNNNMETQKPGEESQGRSFGIGIVDLMALGTSLVQSRKSRYTDRSTEDIRGRSRKDKRQERAEQAALRKEEAREARERAKREKEEDREVIRLAREEERLRKEAEKEADRFNKEEVARQKEADKENERVQKEENARRIESEKEEENRRIETEKENERLSREFEALKKKTDLENERRRQEEAKNQIEAEKLQKQNSLKAAKEEERRRSTASKQSERMQKEAAKQMERQEKERQKEVERAAKEELRRQSAASKESERLAKEEAKEEVRRKKEAAKDAECQAKEEARLKKEQEKEAETQAKEEARLRRLEEKEAERQAKEEANRKATKEPSEPVVHIGQNVYIEGVPPKAKSSSPGQCSPEPEEVVNYHEIVENTKVSVPVNTLIASLVHSSFAADPSPKETTPQVLPMASDRPSRYSGESQFINQRDPSQSSLLRSRYSTEPKDQPQLSQQRQGSTDTDIKPMRQRDPSQSSLLRKRYPSGSIKQGSEDDTSSTQGIQYMHQRDPSQSSLLRKRYSQSVDRSSALENGSAQFDPSGEPAEKVSKNVSFEYDRELDEKVYGGSTTETNISAAEMRDKMEWIERTYNTRDHEYEPIGQPVEEPHSTTTPDPDNAQSENEETKEMPHDISAQSIQDDMEHFFRTPTPPASESIAETYQHENDPEEDATASPPSRRKSFMDTANDRTRQMKQSISNQAGALRTKIQSLKKAPTTKTGVPHDSPKAKERKKFLRSPEFTKLKAIKLHRPDFKRPEFKRPEFTKFKSPEFKINLPDRPKFKMPEALKRTKSNTAKDENEHEPHIEHGSTSVETANTEDRPPRVPVKKGFSFGTYPRIFDRMRKSTKTTESSTTAATISRDNETEEDEESDRIRGPVQFGTFPKMGKQRSPPATASSSHWSENASNLTDNDSGQYQRYSSEPEGMDRESSVERRMRMHLKNALEFEDDRDDDRDSSFNDKDKKQTDEQRQLAEYDEENRVIHEISRQREGEFRQRKPLVHQESDLASEAENTNWALSEVLRKQLEARNQEAVSASINKTVDYTRGNESVQDDRGSTQETQSSGSSSHIRRQGLLDDDDYFEHDKDIERDDFDRYISASVREGLKDHPANALANLSRYSDDRYEYDDEDYDRSNEHVPFEEEESNNFDAIRKTPRRAKGSVESEDYRSSQQRSFEDDEYDKTFPPNRPLRKPRREYSGDSQEAGVEEVLRPVAAEYYSDDRAHRDEYIDDQLDDRSFYDNEHLELQLSDDFSSILTSDSRPFVPTAPARKKKNKNRSVDKEEVKVTAQQYIGRSVSSSYILPETEPLVYRTEHEYPSAGPVQKPPTPLPRNRSRSRSQMSQIAPELDGDVGGKFVIDMTETNGYAVIRKDPPPRPPAPIRRRGGSSRSLGADRPFATLPRRTVTTEEDTALLPERPSRNYSTIGPTRPVRRSSINSLSESLNYRRTPSVSRSDATQYEEIDSFDQRPDSRNLHSGNTLNKMKHRPLPPPPRPPRDRRSTSRRSNEPGDDDPPKYDQDGGAERLAPPLEDTSRISSLDMEEVEEVEVACQTDPLPDDFTCDEFEIDDTMRVLEPTSSSNRTTKTLEDILKEEQQAELDRARQFADEESLSRGIQKFRDANQRSYSERSRGSDRPKTPVSRPITPSSIVIERKTVLSTTETEASLVMRPFDSAVRGREDFIVQDSLEEDSDARLAEDTADTEDERIVNEALRRYRLMEEESSVDQETPPEAPLRKDRSPVTLKEQSPVASNEPINEPQLTTQTAYVEEKILNTISPEPLRVEPTENEPIPNAPPRRKSSTSDTIFGPTPTTVTDLDTIEETRVQPVADPPLEVLPIQTGRLHVSQLEVDSLSVNALQAGRILVSDLQAISLNSQDLECRSGNLVVKGIELPAGFLEELVDRVRDSERQTIAHNIQEAPKEEPLEEPREVPKESPPTRPPPPAQSFYPTDYAPYSIPPPSFYQLRDPSDDTMDILLPPQSPTVPRRRRHHRHHRGEEATSEEEYSRERRRSHHESTSRQPIEAPSVADLSGQLIRACGSAIGRAGARVVAAIRASGHKDENGNQQDVNVGLVILIVIIAVLMMLGMGGGPGRAVHTHHWDYFNPPENEGRK